MKKIFSLATLIFILLGCNQANNNPEKKEQSKTDTATLINVNQPQGSVNPRDLFTRSDAEKILGEPSRLTDSTSSTRGDTLTYQCVYTANSKDQKTGKTGAIYVMFERYPEVSSAQKVYTFIKTANEGHEGLKELHDVGDEAYFHSDGENFYFVLARKAEKMLRMKVNKVTSTTSLDEFNRVTKKITESL